MAGMDLERFRRLVAIDPEDALSRFGLGKKLLEVGEPAEAEGHLRFANAKSPGHLATYIVLGEVLVRLGRSAEAREVFADGAARAEAVGEGMGRDLGPAMRGWIAKIDAAVDSGA